MKYYINEDGNTVFTSQYHRTKGSCCHSNCLHCPFGTTLKNLGVVIHQADDHNLSIIKALYEKLYQVSDSFTSSLLGEAFGKSSSIPSIENMSLLTLKDVPCGLISVKGDDILSFKLLDHFSDQGIDEGYLLSRIRS